MNKDTNRNQDNKSLSDEELCYLPAFKLVEMISSRKVSPVEVTQAYQRRISAFNPKVNAYVTLLLDQALEQARQAETAVMQRQKLGPLHGVPVAIKDLFDFMAGVRNTFGSKPFKDAIDFTPTESTPYVARLLAAGAIPLGKTNTPEFGHKGITDNLAYGPTRSPFDLATNAGGSSGGSSSAMASGLASISQGSDAGGSVRIPAAMSGVVGFKPTFGRIPLGEPPNSFLAHTPFLHPGPITRTVKDAALMMRVMAGPDPLDPFSLPDDHLDYIKATERSIRTLRIAYSPDLDIFPVEDNVQEIVKKAVNAFHLAGAHVEQVKLGMGPSQEELSALWVQSQGLLYAHALDIFKLGGGWDLMHYRDQLTPEFAAMIENVMDLKAVEYRRNEFLRTTVLQTVENVFREYDLLVTPTLSVASVANADNGNTVGPSEVKGVKVNPLIGWCLTYIFNFTGHPAISIPAGFTAEGHPVGLQIVGRRFADDVVLAAAAAFERIQPWESAYKKANAILNS
ncbi:amidase family protein [Ktedonobacteria bacterium brp13]|nr:amidase family protein [Ktedonobacteria bacterium brp13]